MYQCNCDPDQTYYLVTKMYQCNCDPYLPLPSYLIVCLVYFSCDSDQNVSVQLRTRPNLLSRNQNLLVQLRPLPPPLLLPESFFSILLYFYSLSLLSLTLSISLYLFSDSLSLLSLCLSLYSLSLYSLSLSLSNISL